MLSEPEVEVCGFRDVSIPEETDFSLKVRISVKKCYAAGDSIYIYIYIHTNAEDIFMNFCLHRYLIVHILLKTNPKNKSNKQQHTKMWL